MIKKIIRKFGYEITNKREVRLNLFQSVEYLKKMGYMPKFIIDAGVAKGTPGIYENYPNVKTYLVEPLEEFSDNIHKIIKKYPNYIYINKALSISDQKSKLFIKNRLSGSSCYIGKEEKENEVREVESIKLSTLIKEQDVQFPSMLKLDIEGAEENILRETPEIKNIFDVIICEVTFIPKLISSPSFSDIFLIMNSYGYEVFDITDLRYYSKSKNLFQADIIFVLKESSLRTNNY